MEEINDLFGKCPIFTAQKIIGGKWTMLIIQYLSEGTLRFGQLQRKLPMMTQSTLTKQLRNLEEFGLVERIVYPQVPPKVEYSLSEIGKKFMPVLSELSVWGEEYKKYMSRNLDIKESM